MTKKKLRTIFTLLLIVTASLFIFFLKPLTKKEVRLTVIKKNHKFSLGKSKPYFVFGRLGNDTIPQKFKIDAEFLQSNKSLYDELEKDSTYNVEIYGLNFFTNKYITRIYR
jgi:hypothetical protein